MQILLCKLKTGAEGNGLADEMPETRVRLKVELRVRDSTAAPASGTNSQPLVSGRRSPMRYTDLHG